MSFVVEAIWSRRPAFFASRMSPVEASITIAAFAPCRDGAPADDCAWAHGVARSSTSTAPHRIARNVTVRA